MPMPYETHEVFNQSPPFTDVDLLATDSALREAIYREGAADFAADIGDFARLCGSAQVAEWARLANEFTPRLRSYDQKGRRLDVVEFHPAYHDLMRATIGHGQASMAWEHLSDPASPPPRGINVARAAGTYLAAQMEPGHLCPVTMTHAAVPSLRLQPSVADDWIPRMHVRAYDPAFLPKDQKRGVTIGMGMTEKQGGTDVRANTTRAKPAAAGGPGREYLITGHKWFMSAPMCDAFLVLAQASGGLSCFLLPRFLADGSVNAIRIQRLKDKLGNRSNASSEVEFQAAHAWLIGEEGRGVPAIIEMVTETRLDCAVSSAGLMRQALANAIHHARHRTVMQRKLVDQPLMSGVLADMALDVEAATALVFRLARSFDHVGDEREAAWRRVMTPVVKYWVCKLLPGIACEAMECLGGNGYVEEGIAARLYREAPLNAIWEGSGNVMALDVLRVLQREPDAAAGVLDDLGTTLSGNATLKSGLQRVQDMLHEPRLLDRRGRALAEQLAKVTAGALLAAHAPDGVADAFIATRIAGGHTSTYGQGLDRANTGTIVDRALAA